MSLKNAAFLALIGLGLLTLLVAVELINTLMGVVHDVIPAMALLKCLVYVFASLTLTVFLYVFHKNQS